MTQINLLPWREQLREERRQQFLVVLGGSVGFILLIMVLFHMVISNQINRQLAHNNYLQSEINLLDNQIKEIKGLKKQKADLIARMNIIQELESNRPQVVHLFDELVTVLPNGVHLKKINRTGNRVTLIGKAESNGNVSQLMRNIDNSHWLMKPELNEIKTEDSNNGQVSEFILQMEQETPRIEQKG